jgi:hypothetical protein
LGVGARLEGEQVQPSLGTRAEKLQDDLCELDEFRVLLEISYYLRIIIDIAQFSG